MRKMTDGYMVAGAPTYFSRTSKSVTRSHFFTQEDINLYLETIFRRYLISYGDPVNKSADGHNLLVKGRYNKKVGRILKSPQFQVFKNSELYVDSGGFQVSMNYIRREDISLFLDSYIQFLHDYKDYYSYAFALDINFKKSKLPMEYIKKLNHLSYNATSQLSPEMRKRLIFVYHFRTPSVYKIWEDLLEHAFKYSDMVSVGGLVALGDKHSEIILPVVPVCKFINLAKQKKKKSFIMHLLGEGSYKNIFFYGMIRKIIKKYHGMDVKFSYDSSGVFKEVWKGRRMPIMLNDGVIKLISLREKEIDAFKENGLTHRHFVRNLLNEFLNEHINPNLDFDGEFYGDGKLTQNAMGCLLLYYPYFYKKVEKFCEDRVEEIMPLFFNEEYEKFNDEMFKTMRNFNFNKMTPNQRKKTYTIIDALKIVRDLDLKKCDSLVDVYTSNSEIYTVDEFQGNDCFF